MEKPAALMQLAREKYALAEHMLTQTYPLVKDPKLFLSVVDNLFLAMTYATGSLLHLYMEVKKIGEFKENFDEKIHLFDKRHVDWGLSREYGDAMRKMHTLILDHHKSSMVFVKDDQLIICSDEYLITKIDKSLMNQLLQMARSYIHESAVLLNKPVEHDKPGLLRSIFWKGKT